MNQLFSSGHESTWWPWWGWIENNSEFGEAFDDWDKSGAPWIAMNEGTLARKIIDLAVKVEDALGDTKMIAPTKTAS